MPLSFGGKFKHAKIYSATSDLMNNDIIFYNNKGFNWKVGDQSNVFLSFFLYWKYVCERKVYINLNVYNEKRASSRALIDPDFEAKNSTTLWRENTT